MRSSRPHGTHSVQYHGQARTTLLHESSTSNGQQQEINYQKKARKATVRHAMGIYSQNRLLHVTRQNAGSDGWDDNRKASSDRGNRKRTLIAHSEKGIKTMFIVESLLGRLGKITLQADHDKFWFSDEWHVITTTKLVSDLLGCQ